jgi:hypothetical protein
MVSERYQAMHLDQLSFVINAVNAAQSPGMANRQTKEKPRPTGRGSIHSPRSIA